MRLEFFCDDVASCHAPDVNAKKVFESATKKSAPTNWLELVQVYLASFDECVVWRGEQRGLCQACLAFKPSGHCKTNQMCNNCVYICKQCEKDGTHLALRNGVKNGSKKVRRSF